MPLTNILRRASNYILGSECEEEQKFNDQYADNEILFCKNNVCVHPPTIVRQDFDILHHPGYLTITAKTFIDQYNDVKRPTLFLNWIPNTTLRKCPIELQNAKNVNGYLYSKQISIDSIFSNESYERPNSIELKSTNPFLNFDEKHNDNAESLSSEESDKIPSDIININVEIANPDIEIITTPDSVKDLSESIEKFTFSRSESINSTDSQQPQWMSTPEFLALQHNLNFPESTNSSPVLNTKQPHKCRRFNVDLSQMRSLRLFFNDANCTCGQLVVASRESQYKILHFHHGGLDHLAQVLHQWHSLLHNIKYAK
ncbi:TBC1 domain family member 16, partial [Carabus blaptoides fortunei]